MAAYLNEDFNSLLLLFAKSLVISGFSPKIQLACGFSPTHHSGSYLIF